MTDPAALALRARLAARPRHIIDPTQLPTHHQASVLVPLVRRGDDLALVLTTRAASLRLMAGQIAFPGGRVDENDEDHVATAIREADEEIGVEPAAVEVLGLLDDVPTQSGFIITPVVALLTPAPEAYRPNPAEVAEVFEVGVGRLREPGVLVDEGEQERAGRQYRICVWWPDGPQGRKIWGATGRIVWMLLDVLP